MGRKTYIAEQIINKLREAEIYLSQGATIGEVSRKIGVNEQTYYRWRREYGGMRVGQARRLKELEKENSRFKKLVARTSDGRAFRILAILDEYTRECLAILVDRRITLQDVIDQLFYLFLGKLRDELLNREIFTTLTEARVSIDGWRKEYNQVRPHSALGYRPSVPEAVIPVTLT